MLNPFPGERRVVLSSLDCLFFYFLFYFYLGGGFQVHMHIIFHVQICQRYSGSFSGSLGQLGQLNALARWQQFQEATFLLSVRNDT